MPLAAHSRFAASSAAAAKVARQYTFTLAPGETSDPLTTALLTSSLPNHVWYCLLTGANGCTITPLFAVANKTGVNVNTEPDFQPVSVAQGLVDGVPFLFSAALAGNVISATVEVPATAAGSASVTLILTSYA